MGQKSIGGLYTDRQHGTNCFPSGPQAQDWTRRTDLASAMAGRATRLDAGRVTSQDQPTGTGTNPYFLPLSLAQAHGSATQKKSLHAAERDTPENLIRRQEFLAAVAKVDPDHLVFLDETGLTTSMTRLYGRAPAGARIHEAAPESHWSVVTLIAGIRLTGMVAPMTVAAATDGEIFRAYVEHFLAAALRPGDVVVMDNLSSHKVAGVRERIEAAGAKLLYLPPYSPDLNPIEKGWSKIKQLLRAAKARSEQLLDQATAQALKFITPEDAAGWFRLCASSL